MKTLEFDYKFIPDSGRSRGFHVKFELPALSLQLEPRRQYPDWVRLGSNRCPNCPLKESKNPHCPAAKGLLEVVDFFKDANSSEIVDIEIRTEERTYHKRGPLSVGVSSLVGLCMPTSGCPILDKLRPMVFTHLPFATLEQNLHRQLANYMLAQYFRSKRGLKPDWKMEGLASLAEDIRLVNRSFCERLYAVCSNDATLNALVHLDCFADNASFTLKRRGLAHIEPCFSAYFEEDASLERSSSK
ncbi:MAG: hypothetical protein WC728_03115 [Elusimicrobiota bacterium]